MIWCNWCTVYNTRVCYTIICLRKCVWECPWAPLDPTLPYFTTKFWCLNCPSVYPKVADFSTQFYTITRSGCGREHNSATPGQKRYNPCNKYSLPLPSSPQLSHIHPLFLLTFCPAFPRSFFTYISTFLINLFFACQSWPFSRNKTLHRSQNMWFPSLRAAPFSCWQTSHWIVGLGPLIFLFFLWFLLANNPLEGTETCRFVLVCLIKRLFQLLITIFFFDVGIYLHGTHVGRCVDAWPDQHTIYDKDHKDWCGDDASPLILIQMSTRTGVTEFVLLALSLQKIC